LRIVKLAVKSIIPVCKRNDTMSMFLAWTCGGRLTHWHVINCGFYDTLSKTKRKERCT